MDVAGLEVHDVSDHTTIADHGRHVGRGVEHTAVLHARLVADPDVTFVAAQDGGGPDRAPRADGDRSDDHGVGMDERVGGDRRLEVAQGIDRHRPQGSCRTSARTPRPHANGALIWANAMVEGPPEAIPWRAMSRRIDIELTSALGDGTWTWRAAGAKQPKGVVDGSILPTDSSVGDELKVEVEQNIDGVTVLSVVQGRQKSDRDDLLELLPTETEFQPVVETRAKRGRGERRGDRGDRGDRRPRRDGRGDGRGGERRGDGRGGERRGDGRGGERRGDGRGGDRRGDGDRGERRGRGDKGRRGPSFTPPPEVPQRPKPKRLRPGKAHRNEVLNALPEEQRPIAELALQGMPAVRQRLKEENDKAVQEGRAAMPEASVLKLAEELLPRLRVAEWLDRAEAAQRQMEHLDLRDLRSVVAAANDPAVARDEGTRPLVAELQEALVTKQEQELQLWYGDVDAALAVGRVVRALRLSSQPPKAGVPFPADIARRLVDSANASLAPMDSAERWIAMLEAAAFSPVHARISPVRKPDTVSDELLATVKRLAPALPQVAALFEVEVDPDAPMPKPIRQGPRNRRTEGKAAPKKQRASDRPKREQAPPDDAPAPTADESPVPAAAEPTPDTPATETADATEAPTADSAPDATPEPEPTAETGTPDASEAPTADATPEPAPTAETEAAEAPVADSETDVTAESTDPGDASGDGDDDDRSD